MYYILMKKEKWYNQNHIIIISLNYHNHVIGVISFQFIVRGTLFAKIMLPMLKLDTNYGFHELFLNQMMIISWNDHSHAFYFIFL
jgi:hypothetical protein